MPQQLTNFQQDNVPCMSFARCNEPDRIEIQPADSIGPERALTKETVLRYCLMLDDAALSWLCQSVLGQRGHVIKQVLADDAAQKYEEKKLLAGQHGLNL